MKLLPLFAALLTPVLLPAAPAAEGVLLPFREVTVSSAVQGILAAVNVREGDAVATDALLATLIDRVEAAEVARFAKILEQREFAALGTQNLFRDQVVSEGEAIEKRIERDIAKLQHQIALEQLDRRKIRSPIDGLVVEKKKEAGEAVDENEPVFHLVDISRVYLQVFVDASEALKLKAGQRLPVAFPEHQIPPHDGIIDFIDPRIDGASGLVRIKILIDNAGRTLIAGMRGRVNLAEASAPTTP
ncbi:Cobalt-zinc-cadmium resistance protein CzcB [Lacunisphaera limnophila]|uniref:Cobalt-zinc-cadmium resistance protein CzcB n=1 Tax=Lacunisphaera limnophila TaxID=1838286 RepID=A0A1D8AS51_9BACT|nr:efflux RND transporter periplasmic adaptor subunit [Lacunisphaera limnophila]AOS43724.1 Cobalt-zinc-cadmium resistance protein CzcB [Lacunisphaera limnophila]